MRCVISEGWHIRAGVMLAAVLLTLALNMSCGGAATARSYTLHIPAPPPATEKPLPVTLGVERFQAVDALADRRILCYESSIQVKYYEQDLWNSDPAQLLTELTFRYLAQTRLVERVRMLPWAQRVDYVVQGRILNFEELDSGQEPQARVALVLTLARYPSRETLWSGTFRAEEPVEGGGVPALVEALSAATDKVLKQGVAQLLAELSR
jgi:ABC-type uncharacterized transport system auxiliary subunit